MLSAGGKTSWVRSRLWDTCSADFSPTGGYDFTRYPIQNDTLNGL
jgi:hypothetical protein